MTALHASVPLLDEQALHAWSASRGPAVVDVCTDDAVLGAQFSVTERASGEVVRDALPGWLDDHVDRRAFGFELVDTLAELHQVPTAPCVAARLGRDGGYVGRQPTPWRGQREGIPAAGGQARELTDRDAERTGGDVDDTAFSVTLAVWKLAILLAASYHRWLAGMSDDPFFARLETGVSERFARARERCGA